MPKHEDFIVVTDWMMKDLQLKGNELLIYAYIYGVTKDGMSEYRAGLNFFTRLLGISTNTVCTCLGNLTKRGLIEKHEVNLKMGKMCNYKSVIVKDTDNVQIRNTAEQNQNNNKPKKKNKAKEYINKVLTILEEYEFSQELIDCIVMYFEDKLEKGIYEGENYLTLQFTDLAKLTNKKAIESVKLATKNGYKGMVYEQKQNSSRGFTDTADQSKVKTGQARIDALAQYGLKPFSADKYDY